MFSAFLDPRFHGDDELKPTKRHHEQPAAKRGRNKSGGREMGNEKTDECCPRFDPKPWDETMLTWEGRRFVKDRVTSFLHIPLNYGSVMTRTLAALEAADATPANRIIITDENSLWGADVYVEATKDVPGAAMATISGTFLSKVFEGPFSKTRTWIEEMKAFVQGKGKGPQKMYFFYTTCPKCAKKYGKNYVAILAQV
jgi:hypothetical protein